MDKVVLFKRCFIFFIGLVITQVGVALELVSNVGSDGFTVFIQGLSKVLNVTPGISNIIILFGLLCIILLFGREYIKIGTFICLICTGPILDLFILLLNNFGIGEISIVIRCLFVVLASIIIAVGFSILSSTSLGIAPNDIIPFIIKDKSGFQYKWIRMILDFSYLIIGFILGGVIGVGTIILAITLGPFIQFCIPYGERITEKVTKIH